MSNEITHIDKSEQEQASTAITRAHTVILKTEEDMGWASDDLATLRKMRKAFEAKLKELCKPFKEGIEALKAEFDLIIVPLQDAEKVVDTKITLCRNVLRPVQDVARGFKVPTTGAKTGVMKVAKWKVVNESLVPMTILVDGKESEPLWVLNEGAITRIRKAAGMEATSTIPGIEFYFDETNTVR